ncbi:hypothetical protein GGD71_006678 [Variovorax guangxiensis]|uniref:Uncharacterized protein n=2 Tax=Variovorax guangxiensis TaxID=1775474 RepID=A0A840G045_9BURK|nr:hypothetical protein [Variovorax guangxiensis]
MLLGVYRSSAECTLSMVGLRLVNIKNGQVDKELKFGCGAGMVTTLIFAKGLSRGKSAPRDDAVPGRLPRRGR